MTTLERSIERQMTVLEYLVNQGEPLRLQAFDPMLNRVRSTGDWRLFPLNRTTIKSTLVTLARHGLVKTESIKVGKRAIIHYTITDEGRKSYQAYKGA